MAQGTVVTERPSWLRAVAALDVMEVLWFVVVFLSLAVMTTVIWGWSATKGPQPTEQQLKKALQGLQQNSEQAAALIERLQRDVAERHRTALEIERRLQELRQQRTLLELTPEQRRGLEGLVRRQPSPWEIFASTDFWIGRFLPSAVFFGAGVAFTLWRTRRVTVGPLKTTPSKR